MVEQEYSKSSAVFSESLPCKLSQNNSSDQLCISDTTLIKSEELCSSDLLNAELLYGSVFSTSKTFCSPLLSENMDDKKIMFQEAVPNDIFSANDCSPCDLYYDKSISHDWNPISEKNSVVSDCYNEPFSPLSFWGSCPLDCETLKMDDIFQVDKDDLVQSPTLAELNANDESLFDSFDNFDIPLPTEHKYGKSSLSVPIVSADTIYKISLSEASQEKTKSDTSSDRTNLTLHAESSEKVSFPENDSVFGFVKENKRGSYSSDSIEKSIEKANIGTQVVITRHEKKFVLSSESGAEASKRKKADNASELPLPLSNQMLDSEDDDSEMDYDYSSDVDEESEEESKVHSSKQSAAKNLSLQKKKSRYFWQYNIQSKGPKGPKMKLDGKSAVTDNSSGISDPVFTSNYLNKGIKHAGKARRGDGNDLTPNPQKLYNIGLELEKLTSVIEGLVPANELPVNARSDSRKEKNKLASRACRLKKKAQHEANKLKLFGLQKEQKHLQSVINDVEKVIRKSAENIKQGKVQSNVHAKIEALCLKKCYTAVAGCSAEFVNNVLKSVGSGDKTGGLDIETEEE